MRFHHISASGLVGNRYRQPIFGGKPRMTLRSRLQTGAKMTRDRPTSAPHTDVG